MFWTFLDRCVNLVFLLLAVIIITILLNTNSENISNANFTQKLEVVKSEMKRVMENNLNYLETRLNKVSERQDDYQVSTDQRVYVLEQRVKELQADKKNNQKMIQNNIQTQTNTNN